MWRVVPHHERKEKDMFGFKIEPWHGDAVLENEKGQQVVCRYYDFNNTWKYRTRRGGWARVKDENMLNTLFRITDEVRRAKRGLFADLMR